MLLNKSISKTFFLILLTSLISFNNLKVFAQEGEIDPTSLLNFTNSHPNIEFRAGSSSILILLGAKPNLGTVIYPSNATHKALTILGLKKPKLNIKYRSSQSPDVQLIFKNLFNKDLEFKGQKYGLDIIKDDSSSSILMQAAPSNTSSISYTSLSSSSSSSSTSSSAGPTGVLLYCTDLEKTVDSSLGCAWAEGQATIAIAASPCEPGCSAKSIVTTKTDNKGSSCAVTVEQECCLKGSLFDDC